MKKKSFGPKRLPINWWMFNFQGSAFRPPFVGVSPSEKWECCCCGCCCWCGWWLILLLALLMVVASRVCRFARRSSRGSPHNLIKSPCLALTATDRTRSHKIRLWPFTHLPNGFLIWWLLWYQRHSRRKLCTNIRMNGGVSWNEQNVATRNVPYFLNVNKTRILSIYFKCITEKGGEKFRLHIRDKYSVSSPSWISSVSLDVILFNLSVVVAVLPSLLSCTY